MKRLPGVKVTLRLDPGLVKELALVSKQQGVPAGRLVDEALRLWSRRRFAQELEAGYLAIAGEDVRTANERLGALSRA